MTLCNSNFMYRKKLLGEGAVVSGVSLYLSTSGSQRITLGVLFHHCPLFPFLKLVSLTGLEFCK